MQTTRVTTITTRSKIEAESIARELAGFDSELSEAPRGWTVTVGVGAELGPVLNALEDCLAAHSISSVGVSIDGRTYVMEGMSL